MRFENQYLTYDEYLSLGGEQIGNMPFNLLEFDARTNIDKYTFGRLKELSSQKQEVKLCMYKLINSLKSYQNYEKGDKSVSNESIDGYSVTYASSSADISTMKQRDIKDIIHTNLASCKLDDDTPYLYVGV